MEREKLQTCDRCGAPESAAERGNGCANWCVNCRLEGLADELREQNPGSHVYVDNRAVWLRVGEKDLGIYSTILGRDDIYCTVEDGPQGRWTPLSRPVKAGEA